MCSPLKSKVAVHEEVDKALNGLIDGLYAELRELTRTVSDLEMLLETIFELSEVRY